MSSNLLKRDDTRLLGQSRIVIDVNKRFSHAEACEGSGEAGGMQAADLWNLADTAPVLTNDPGGRQAMLEEASREAREMVEAARIEADRILEEARGQAVLERENAHREGFDAGFQDGMGRARIEQDRLEEELKVRRCQLEEEYEELLERLEPEMVDALCGIYEYVFKVDMKSHRDVLLHLIGSAMRKMESTKSFLIRVSAEDYPYVSMQKKILPGGGLGNSVVEVIEDISLHKGQCMIETDGGIFDCGLGTQMEELRKRLMMLAYQRDA